MIFDLLLIRYYFSLFYLILLTHLEQWFLTSSVHYNHLGSFKTPYTLAKTTRMKLKALGIGPCHQYF